MIIHERLVFGCCVRVGWIDSVQLTQRVVAAQIDSSAKRHTNLLRGVHKQSLWNPDGARFTPTSPDRPWGPPSLQYNGNESLSRR